MPTTTAERVKALRVQAGLTQRELDVLSGICVSHTSMIECGLRQNITADTARGLARATGATLDWLLSGAGDPPTDEQVSAAVAAARAALAATAEPPAPVTHIDGGPGSLGSDEPARLVPRRAVGGA